MTHRRIGISALSAALLMLVAAPASAQQVDSFTQLQLLVEPGDKVVVTDSTGNPTEGRIGTLSGSSLRLLVDGVARDLSEPEVP